MATKKSKRLQKNKALAKRKSGNQKHRSELIKCILLIIRFIYLLNVHYPDIKDSLS